MQITKLIELAEAKLRNLQEQAREFERVGDVESLARVTNEITETQDTLIKLKQV